MNAQSAGAASRQHCGKQAPQAIPTGRLLVASYIGSYKSSYIGSYIGRVPQPDQQEN
jgi:hypothetical protein